MFIINESDATIDYEFGPGSGSGYQSYPSEWTEIAQSGAFDLYLSNVPGTSEQTFENLAPGAAIKITDSGAVETPDSGSPNSHSCRYVQGSSGWSLDTAHPPCPSGSGCIGAEVITSRHPYAAGGQIIEIPCEGGA